MWCKSFNRFCINKTVNKLLKFEKRHDHSLNDRKNHPLAVARSGGTVVNSYEVTTSPSWVQVPNKPCLHTYGWLSCYGNNKSLKAKLTSPVGTWQALTDSCCCAKEEEEEAVARCARCGQCTSALRNMSLKDKSTSCRSRTAFSQQRLLCQSRRERRRRNDCWTKCFTKLQPLRSL